MAHDIIIIKENKWTQKIAITINADFLLLRCLAESEESRRVEELVKKGVFLRKASGLVKTASTLDVFIYDTGLINIGLGIAFVALYGPSFYLGSNMALASVFALLLWIPLGIGFFMWSMIFQRSGASYIYPSRAYHPILGVIVGSMEYLGWLAVSVGIPAAWFSTIGLTNFFFVMGTMTKNTALANLGSTVVEPRWIVTIGAVFILLQGILVASGTKNFFRMQKGLFAVAMFSTVVMVGVLLVSTRNDAISSFNTYMNPALGVSNAYQYVISTAASNGWSSVPFSLWQSFKLNWWISLPFGGAIGSIAIAGEIKKFQRSQFWGINGSLLFCTAFFVVAFVLLDNVFGYNFIGSAGYLSVASPPPLPVSAWPQLYAAFLSQNVVVAFIITIGFVIWPYFWMAAALIFADRTLLAMSLDRMLPDKIGEVNERTHTPLLAVAIVTAIATGFLLVYVYALGQVALITSNIYYIPWLIVMATGVAFPYLRKEMFNRSPVAKWKVGSIPLFSIVCAIGTACILTLVLMTFADTFAAGTVVSQLEQVVPLGAAAAAVYLVMRWHRKRQGIDLDQVFKEIPIE
jgi:basic amino acid/polyamine antiporter, APA family